VKNIDVKCECKTCGMKVEIEMRDLKNGFTCPKCGCEEYRILL